MYKLAHVFHAYNLLMYKTAVYRLVNGIITHQKQQITAGTLVSSSVNGDIAIQWEWSNFDFSQNPNPLNDYDKT